MSGNTQLAVVNQGQVQIKRGKDEKFGSYEYWVWLSVWEF